MFEKPDDSTVPRPRDARKFAVYTRRTRDTEELEI